MKGFFVSIVLICAWRFSSCCEENWYNKCKNNGECCSGNCDKPPEWENGICKPAVTDPNETGGKCEEDWSNRCRGNDGCCSGICDKDPSWEFGVCKPKPVAEKPVTEKPVTENPKCGEDWSNRCRGNDQCCSGICDKDPNWEFGVCKPKPVTEKPTTEKPVTENPKCEVDWYNECVENKQCCSGFCDRPQDFKFGICKPKPPPPEPEPTKCEDDWFNKCTSNKHCCSNFCDKDPSWEFGVCKPRKEEPPPGNGQCLTKNEIGCKDKPCCGNLICSNGPDNNWIQGLCSDHEYTPPPKEPEENEDEDDEDGLSYYKRFVQDKLYTKNDQTFDSKPLKCREIDVQGQFFFNYNETHSFRICDTCADFPFEKLKDVRISDPPRQNISEIPFNECFSNCVDEDFCVAMTYDEDYHTCYLFDSIQGNYDDDEYGWTTVILTQPVFVLKDYVLSRHTETICDGEPNFQYQTNDMLKCFNHCEKHNCQVATFHEDSCKIYMEEKTCKNIYYKYGYYSLMYRDYFHDSNEWRFTEIVKDKSDEEELEEDILYQSALESSSGNPDAPKVNPQLSNLTLLENRKVQRENFLHTCFSNCMSAELCTGVFVNFNEFVCKISDWESLKARGHEEKGFNEYKLVHKKRDSVLYQYDETVDIPFSRITYNENFRVGNIKDCVQKCNQYDHCLDIYYNMQDNTCLIVGEFPKRSMTIQDPKKWINFRNNRIGFNQEQSRFARVGKNQYLSPKYDKYLLESVRIDGKPSNFESASEKCFNTCNRHTQDCQFVQISRTENSFECKLYKDITGDEERSVQGRISTDLFARFLDAKFDVNYLNKESVFNEFDAVGCKPDVESIIRDADYLYRNNDRSIQTSTRAKRGIKDFFKKVGKFFKKVGEAIIETPKKIVQTGINIVKSIDKAVKGDKKGALQTFRDAPLVKSAENLYHDVKKVGEGVIKGDLKKIGEGALGVVTNDFVDFIPGGGGKVIKGIGKGVKGAIKGGADKAKDKAKKDAKKDKKEISDKNKRKNDEKEKKDKEEKAKKCNRKNKRQKRQTAGQKRKRNDCDNDCEQPDTPKGSRGKLLPRTLESCNNVKPKTKCNYLCNAGYTEDPYTLTCQDDGKWSPRGIGCKPQECGTGRYKTIYLYSASAVFNSKQKSEDVLLYAVHHDSDKKYSLWSIAYHKWQITSMKPDDRAGHFLQHPCPALKKRQLSNNHFTVGNPNGLQRGHLSPADLFRWNEKSANTGNLFINIHPQTAQFNMGSWKTLETAVHCASKNKIKAIVATGVGGKVIDHVGGPNTRVEVREFFWKLVCYKHGGKTHVAAFIGNNRFTAKESQQQKKDTLTPRDQNDVIRIAPDIANPAHNPWATATAMIAKDKFVLAGRYPTPPECAAAMTLDDAQKKSWKEQFTIFGGSKRRKRQAEGSPFCSKKELDDYKSWAAPFTPKDEDASKIDGDDDDDGGDDGGADAGNIPSKGCGKRIVGYYASWGKNKVSRATFSRFTHIVYAFFEVQSDGRVVLGNPDYSTSSNHDEVRATAEKRLNHLLNIKDQLPNLKVMFAVGGWENSQYFSKIAGNQGMKVTFIASVLKMIDDYRMDGVDIDWEYPVAGGAVTGVPDDKPNYVKLMSDLRFALDEKAKKSGREKFLLTFAGAAGETALRVGYDLPNLLKYADWVNVMSYDFFGPWDSKWGAYTGPPAPLYHNAPKGYSGKYNVNWAIKHYVCKLKSPKQVVMGVPLYGRYWHNVPAKSGEYAIYRMANPVGGKFPGGFVPWKDIKKDWLNNPKYQHTFDQKVKSPFAYGDGTYLGYESPESVKEKVKFAIEKGLGGLMAWEIGQDDNNEMIDLLSQANLCTGTSGVEFKCIPIEERRWWTFEENEEMAGLCGKSAPLYKGYYPVCDPDDLGYSCCGAFGYCGSGSEYCDCPTCYDYAKNPDKILEEPIKPKGKVRWHFLNAPDGSRGRCGKDVPKVGDSYAICNPDDGNAHCCSNGGYCGSSKDFCECKECIDFTKKPDYNFS